MGDVKRPFREDLQDFLYPLWIDKLVTIKGLFYKSVGVMYVMSVPLFIRWLTQAVEQGNYSEIKIYIGVFVAYSFVALLLRSYTKDRGWVTMGPWYRRLVQDIYIEKYMYLDNNYAEKLGTGRSIAIISNGANIWGSALKDAVEKMAELLIGLTFTVIVLGLANWLYVLVLVGVIIISVGLATYRNITILQGRRLGKKVSIAYTNHIVRILMSKFEILQSDKRSYEKSKIYMYMGQTINVVKSYSLYLMFFFFGNKILLNITTIGLLGIIGFGVIDKNVAFSEFVSVATMMVLINNTVHSILRYYKDVSKDWVHIEKIIYLFLQAPHMKMSSDKPSFVCKNKKIQLKNISYAYDEYVVFKDFSLEIQGGQKTALVGVSGSGKSTLVKLIVGYLRLDSGKIIVDGQDLHELSLKSYYKHIGYLTQEPMVFDGTVWENFTYALDLENQVDSSGDYSSAKKPSQDDDTSSELMQRVEEAVRLAKCEFIYDFKDGLQTEIGERGIRLSGGQRQRLAIAKIFLKDPEIIILDEPTSALDSFSEEAITEAMHNLFKDRTTIIIAHRLQTVKEADDIIVLGEGSGIGEVSESSEIGKKDEKMGSVGSFVLERGTHEELIEMGGHYAKMLELQSGF